MRIFCLVLLVFSGVHCSAQDYLAWTSGPSIDLGEVSFRKGKKANFTFQNIGTDTLTIETVRTSCSCTAVDWQKEPIAPQDSTTLTIKFMPNSEGIFKKTVRLFFYEKKKVVKMKIHGEALRP